MQPLSGNQRPDLLTSLMNMSLVLRLPRKMHLCRSSSNVPRLPSFLEMPQNLHVLLTFDKGHNPLRLPRETTSERPKVVRPLVFLTFLLPNVLCATTACTFSTSQLPKVVRSCCVLYVLTSKCASRHNGVHFFDISTSKSGPELVCFAHFDLEMRFAPACNFSTSQLPKAVRTWCFLYIVTSTCASRHNGIQFLSIFHLSSAQRAPHPLL